LQRKASRCRAEVRARWLVGTIQSKANRCAQPRCAPLCDPPDATGIVRKNRIDPVARFHLGNGARLERINWLGNTELRAIQKSFGVTVNYLYGHYSTENNHEAFVRDGTTVRSPEVDALMRGPA
jgi:hypothetical protein